MELIKCKVKRYNHPRKMRKNRDGIKIISPTGTIIIVLMKRVRREDQHLYDQLNNDIAQQDKLGPFPVENRMCDVNLTRKQMQTFVELHNRQRCITRVNEIQTGRYMYFKPHNKR